MNTPIYDFVKGYAEKNGVRFHMPGHKGKGPLGIEALDITEIKGADVLSEAYGIIGESERNASLLFQTGRTVYLTGGSTAAIEAMLALASTRYRTPERPNLLASRNAHRAFLHGVALLDIPVTFMLPDNAETVYSGVMTPNDVARAIEANAPFAVYITSPSYLGEIWDIAGIAAVCKKHGVPLLVDNAHGAYFAFLNPSMHPIHLGAAMCADSAHKTLPVLTGGAYLHIAKGYEDEFSDVKDAVSLFSSTSPSYLTLSSLDLANRVLAEGYGERLKKAVSLTEDTKTALSQAGFTVLPSEPLKIVLLSPHAEALAEVGECLALVFDNEGVLAASGKGAKEYVGECASEELSTLLNQRTVKRAARRAGEVIIPLFRHAVVKTEAQVIVPVIANGDLLGAVCLLSSKEGDAFGEREVYAAKCAAAYLSKRFS